MKRGWSRDEREAQLRMRGEQVAGGIFRMLHVCTGNVCRSPYAEILTRHMLFERLGAGAANFDVASAGVGAVVGSGIHPGIRSELDPFGSYGGAEVFVARQLVPPMLAGVDLVLGATTAHRSAIVKLVPRALPVTFSLREFARLAAAVDRCALPDDPLTRARVLVPLARAQRGLAPPRGPDADQIPDPVGLGAAAHRKAAERIHEAVATIVDVLVR